MPTKEELADELVIAKLKELAEANDVDLGDATRKQDIVEKIVSSRKVTKEDIEEFLAREDDDEASDVVTNEEGQALDATSGRVLPAVVEYEPVADSVEGPGYELLPLINEGQWVRLKGGNGIPARFRNMNAVVVTAPKEVVPGSPDGHAENAIEVQDKRVKFVVRIRETGEITEVTRDNIAKVATNPGDLVSVG